MRFAQPIRHFLLAVQFFTRIPVNGRLAEWVGYSPQMLRASAAHFPGVGYLLGGMTGALFCLMGLALPDLAASPWVAATAATALGAYLTGAFHEDGLADLADGLGGSMDRGRALEIMKDSRIGSFGAVALVLSLLAKVGLLALLMQALGAVAATAVLVAAAVVSRFMPLWLIRLLPHVGNEGGSKSKPLADQISAPALAVAVLWMLPAAISLHSVWPSLPWWSGAVGAALAWAWMWRLLARRLQGFTGDALGATQQLCEVFFYLGMVLAWAPGH
ncbi:adenosylcobinamide-GDP ribazoletransferase [Hydrogenophaga sp. 5NK40-0174]|uniref:adenosylcobinamide-GDP ribazoletransferase n=1 Tax=Hydrogenophaga sp. 5NK40-0174 TaxID=3127649 RepID=UPI0031027582